MQLERLRIQEYQASFGAVDRVLWPPEAGIEQNN